MKVVEAAFRGYSDFEFDIPDTVEKIAIAGHKEEWVEDRYNYYYTIAGIKFSDLKREKLDEKWSVIISRVEKGRCVYCGGKSSFFGKGCKECGEDGCFVFYGCNKLLDLSRVKY